MYNENDQGFIMLVFLTLALLTIAVYSIFYDEEAFEAEMRNDIESRCVMKWEGFETKYKFYDVENSFDGVCLVKIDGIFLPEDAVSIKP